MTARTSSRPIVFRHPFRLPGMDTPHPPGTFELRIEEEDLDVMWHASRMSRSIILTYPGRSEAWAVTADDLDRALANDKQSDIDTGHS
jgi:hypothetical protein